MPVSAVFVYKGAAATTIPAKCMNNPKTPPTKRDCWAVAFWRGIDKRWQCVAAACAILAGAVAGAVVASLPLMFLHRAWPFLHCAWLCLHRAWLFLHCAWLFLHCADASKMAQAPPACCPPSFEPEGQEAKRTPAAPSFEPEGQGS